MIPEVSETPSAACDSRALSARGPWREAAEPAGGGAAAPPRRPSVASVGEVARDMPGGQEHWGAPPDLLRTPASLLEGRPYSARTRSKQHNVVVNVCVSCWKTQLDIG